MNALNVISGSIVFWLVVPTAGVFQAQGGREERINSNTLVIQDFEKRVADYVKLHKDAEAQLPLLKPTSSPAKIMRHQHEFARRIRAARRQALPGDIFSADISAEFRRLIAITMQGPEAARIRESLANAEPVRLRLRVNRIYPPYVPLQSTPPTLLLNLPKLPAEVEYRVVDHALVLRDVGADLIIDFMTNAIP